MQGSGDTLPVSPIKLALAIMEILESSSLIELWYLNPPDFQFDEWNPSSTSFLEIRLALYVQYPDLGAIHRSVFCGEIPMPIRDFICDLRWLPWQDRCQKYSLLNDCEPDLGRACQKRKSTKMATAENLLEKEQSIAQFFNRIRLAARLDLATYFENSHKLPTMMFETTNLFERWIAGERGLQIDALKGASIKSMRRVHGKIVRNSVTLCYDQLWARAKFTGYREPFVKHHATRDGIDPVDLKSLHADHVINRARMKQLADPWVVIFPVRGETNVHFGSLVEKKLPPLVVGVGKATLDPLPAFKIFCESIPETASDVEKQLTIVAGWFAVDCENNLLISNFLSEMRRQVEKSVK